MNLFCKAYPRHSIKYSISYIEYLGIESCFLLVVSNIFLCSSLAWGNDSQFDEHIFQMGWFNHQPAVFCW